LASRIERTSANGTAVQDGDGNIVLDVQMQVPPGVVMVQGTAPQEPGLCSSLAETWGSADHQLRLLPFHIVGEQPLCIRRMFEEPAVKYPTESSMGEAQRIDDVLTRSTCSGVTLKTQPKQADHNKCPHTWAFAATLSP
jgi:hypothetical protein